MFKSHHEGLVNLMKVNMNIYLWSSLPFLDQATPGLVIVQAHTLKEAIDQAIQHLIDDPEEDFLLSPDRGEYKEERLQQIEDIKQQLQDIPFKCFNSMEPFALIRLGSC